MDIRTFFPPRGSEVAVLFGCIYLITNIVNGKKYVGQHNEPDVTKRWREHWYDTDRGCEYALHRAMRKYGRDSFNIDILCVIPNGDAICRMEEYFAEQFETYMWDVPGGYNMIPCGKHGRSGMKSTPLTIEKQSLAMKAFRALNPVSADTRKKMSDAALGREPPNKGLPCSDEKRNKCSISGKAYFAKPEARERASEIMKAYYAVNPISTEQRKKMTSKPVSAETRTLLSARSTATWEKERHNNSEKSRASKYGRFIYMLRSGRYTLRCPGLPSKTFQTPEEAAAVRDTFLVNVDEAYSRESPQSATLPTTL